MPELSEKQGEIIVETRAKELLELKSTNEKDMIMEYMAKECGIYFDGNRRRRHFLQNHSMRSLVNYFEQLIRISDMKNYELSWLKIDLKERLAERITSMRHRRFFMSLLQKDYEDLNTACLNYMIPYIVERGGEQPIYDESIGQVLYLCYQMTKVDMDSDNLVNCVIMLYSIALKEADEELKKRLIGNSLLGQWEYGAFSRGLIGQKREVQMLSEKMKLELDVTGLIDNTKSDADNIEAVLRANWSRVIAWLYAGLFITMDHAAKIYKRGIIQKNVENNDGEKRDIFLLAPAQYAVKNYFKSIYPDEQDCEKNIEQRLRDVIAMMGETIDQYIQAGQEGLEEQQIKQISEKLYQPERKKEYTRKNELSVELLYNIGQTIENSFVIYESGKGQIRFLERTYLIIQNQLDRAEKYYKKLGVDYNVRQQFKKSMQSRLLFGEIPMTTEERDEFDDRMGKLLNEIQGTTIIPPRE